MRHARPDYSRIQDPAGLIPDDEPVFLIRGQDRTAHLLVQMWAMLNELAGADMAIVSMAYRHAEDMKEWQRDHPAAVKTADLPGAPPRRVLLPGEAHARTCKLCPEPGAIGVNNSWYCADHLAQGMHDEFGVPLGMMRDALAESMLRMDDLP